MKPNDRSEIELGSIALGRERQQIILETTASFDRFEPDNDPYGEHDFGAPEADGERTFLRIDYDHHSRCHASPDPAEPA